MQDSGSLLQKYREASRRLLLLDYDGVLTPIVDAPSLAAPTPELRELLADIASDKRNKIVIVTGRSHQEINTWVGDLPIDISAEHGCFRKVNGSSWQQLYDTDDSWKQTVLPQLEAAVIELPGSFIEHKSSALVLHYRSADSLRAEELIPVITKSLQQLTVDSPAVVQSGKKVIDVHLSSANKGVAVAYWLDQAPKYDFILTAGDDVTDEDMFQAMPRDAHTYHVGADETLAKHSLPTSGHFIELLTRLTAGGSNL